MERLIDMAARKIGLDPAEMRRRNLVRSEEFPLPDCIGHYLGQVRLSGMS
jgi:carbon-monoxide dehydrogenase large subunit